MRQQNVISPQNYLSQFICYQSSTRSYSFYPPTSTCRALEPLLPHIHALLAHLTASAFSEVITTLEPITRSVTTVDLRTVPSTTCLPWCPSHVQDWTTKCNWWQCGTCTQCFPEPGRLNALYCRAAIYHSTHSPPGWLL